MFGNFWIRVTDVIPNLSSFLGQEPPVLIVKASAKQVPIKSMSHYHERGELTMVDGKLTKDNA